MAIFLLAAIPAFFLVGAAMSRQDSERYFESWPAQFVTGVVALIFLGIAVIGIPPVSPIVTTPEVLQLVLGALFGGLLRFWWPAWTSHLPDGQVNPWSAAVLIALPLLTAVSPHLEGVFGSLTGVKAVGLEFQFGSKTAAKIDERPVFEVEREKQIAGSIDNFTRFTGIIADDILLLKLRSVLADHITEPAEKAAKVQKISKRLDASERARDFFKELLLPLASCVSAAKKELQNEDSIRDALKPVVRALTKLSEPASTDPRPDVLKSVTSAHQMLRALLREPKDCVEAKRDRWPDGLRRITGRDLADGPHIHYLVANLLWADRNIEKAIDVLRKQVDEFPDDVNVTFTYARLLYAGEREIQPEVLTYLDRALKIVNSVIQDAGGEIARGSRDLDARTLAAIKTRFERGRRWIINETAYLSAQAGVGEPAALKYAAENYAVREEIAGILPFMRVAVIDTHGYVKMAAAVRTSPLKLDQMRAEIEDARRLFREAMDYAKRLENPSERRAATRTVELHDRQAEKLLGELRLRTAKP